MGSFLEVNEDIFFIDNYFAGGIDKISEYVTGLGILVAIANSGTQQPVETACHEGEL